MSRYNAFSKKKRDDRYSNNSWNDEKKFQSSNFHPRIPSKSVEELDSLDKKLGFERLTKV